MKLVDGWMWPEGEEHMTAWISAPRNRVMLNGRPAYQGKKQVAALDLCRSFRTAIDVGAHVGTWAYNLAPVFRNVRCFEPLLEHRNCFALNVEAANVVMYPLALGDQSGMVSIRTNPSSSGDSYVDTTGAGEQVRIERLDSFDFFDVDFLKVDTEGFEEPILRGAEQTIRRCRPVICVEQKHNFARKFGLQPQGGVAYLQTLGYRVAQEIGGDYLCVPTDY